MITVEELRNYASTLPGVEETAEIGLATFTVSGVAFLGLEASRSTVVVRVDEDLAASAVHGHGDLYEEVWSDDDFVGLRVDLARAPERRVQELVVAAWQHTAPADLLVLRR